MVKEIVRYKIDTCAVQESRWSGKGTVMKENSMILYSGHTSDRHEFGTEFYISRHVTDSLFDFEPVNERICKIRVKPKYYNFTFYINTHLNRWKR